MDYIETIEKGAAFGVSAITIMMSVVKMIGRPVLFSILNGRYETKVEAEAARAVLKTATVTMQDALTEKVDSLAESVGEIHTDVRDINKFLRNRHQ